MSDFCETCAHWHEAGAQVARLTTDTVIGGKVGTCQLNAPEMFVIMGTLEAYWPRTHASRTCGDWSPCAPVDGGGGGDEEEEATPDRSVVVPFGRAAA